MTDLLAFVRQPTRTALAVFFVSLIATPVPAATLIQIENDKPGSSEWRLTNPGNNTRVIEGYASATSVNRGGRLELFVNTRESSYTLDVFRMGYYKGLLGRRMLPTITRTGVAQPACPMDSFGTVECDWLDPYVLSIPGGSDATDWMSGIYLVKLTAGTSRKQQYIVFVVRDDLRFTDLLMQQSVSTYQAYNVWGGKSLYGTSASLADTANKAMKVSFDRPYQADGNNGQGQFFFDSGAGWEFDMVQWLEREGYDVSYATNVDVDADPNLLMSHKAFLSVGHDEYWSWRMRDHVERARDSGISLGFFSGNTAYWQVRFEPGVANPAPGRIMVGYKEFCASDPILPTYLRTCLFRDKNVNRSEDAMMGVRFITQTRPPFVVEDASHWAFTGTGLKNGDVLRNADGSSFLGYEVDGIGPFSPPNTQRLAHNPATSRWANFGDMTVYRAASGATVFSTGSIAWSKTVPQIQQVTRNVLARFIRNEFADTVPVRPPLPSPFAAADIGAIGRPGFVALAGPDSFTLNGSGTDAVFAGTDAMYYAYQTLTGDGQITVRLTSLQNFWDNRAGVQIRESLAPTSRTVSVLGRPSESAGSVLEGIEFRVKSVAGGAMTKLASINQPMPNWLRLTRAGSTFTAQTSPDGVVWTDLGSTTLTLSSTVYIGAVVASAQKDVWATAVFDNVTVTGGSSVPPPPPPSPTTVCSALTLSRTAFYSGATESNWTVTATAPTATCTWSVASDVPWVVVRTVPTPAVGSGTLRVTALTNTTTSFRTGRFTIAGQTYTVKQEAGTSSTPPADSVPPVVSLSSPTAVGTVSGVAPIAASATDNVAVVGVQFKVDGVNFGAEDVAAPYSTTWNTAAAANGAHTVSAVARDAAGNVTTASVAVTVSNVIAPPPPPPAGSPCASVVLSRTFFYSGRAESNWTVAVTAPVATCTWTPVPDSSWIVVVKTTPDPAVGTGSFQLRVLSNTTGVGRTGRFTVAGATYTVTQE